MKKIGIMILYAVMFFLGQASFAGTGNLFEVTSSGTPATLDIILCLNGRGPLSCQNYTVTRRTLSIRTIAPNHIYPAVGIKVKTPGFSLTGCTFIANGFCIFSASNTSFATVTVTSLETEATLTEINPPSGSAAGGTGVILTGTGLSGTTGVTFGGTAAIGVNVVNSTTVTAVTPAHAAGVVDVVITTTNGDSTLANGYTYLPTAVGQSSNGGTIACLGAVIPNLNLIASIADNSTGIQWGGNGVITNAQSTTNGAANTTTIIATVGNNGGIPYAAQLCNNFEVDSRGNTPCQAGNICYNDWFLPAKDQLNCLFINKDLIGGFSMGDYWSSTEFFPEGSEFNAWSQSFNNGSVGGNSKNDTWRVRCVRAFTP
ncbi:Lcl C-terminal domain-containing protein [Legionella impletisoli]|uniref:IPT/TIG domain-containing protein n=1 Tax=Legionella impletisoli TaxID=343510 RepID=A0A917JNV6_9GAMM|nr:DUF1566 domain-containing protein [Legionella impletisoli]GGI78440.1 hypothetical protein GCM10007966_03870 [Legionella impletisoli]